MSSGARLLLTRDEEGNRRWTALLRLQGHEAVSLPCVNRQPIDTPELRRRLHSLAPLTHWWLLTSTQGVECLRRLLPEHNFADAQGRVAAVGPRTADVCRRLLGRCDFHPDQANARSLANQLLPRLTADQTVVAAVADRARTELQDILQDHGPVVQRVEVYRTVSARSPSDDRPLDPSTLGVDGVLVASPSAAEGLVNQAPQACHWQVPVVAIGPTTADALHRLGFDPLVAPVPSLSGMLDAWRGLPHDPLSNPARRINPPSTPPAKES